jgi:hypothetical protein
MEIKSLMKSNTESDDLSTTADRYLKKHKLSSKFSRDSIKVIINFLIYYLLYIYIE